MEREIRMAIAFIPVRGGSKSIPLKNIKPFCGKPLIYWNLLALENVERVEKIIVATDSNEIELAAKSFGFKKVEVYRRNPVNATDTASTESVMLEYILSIPADADELFILAQATSPLTQSSDFQKALDLLEGGEYDSLLSCVRSKRFFWNEDGTPLNYDYQARPRRQDFDGLLMENGAFYINRIGNIKRDKNRLSGRIVSYEMEEYTAVEIDEEDDWIVAEAIMRRHFLKPDASPSEPVQLFLSDVDGTLTDAGMYYDQKGNELKKFNTHDGKGFELLRNQGIKTGILTSENTAIVDRRAKKLKIDFLVQDVSNKGKLQVAMDLCNKMDISLSSVAYIGDDVNCLELLESVGYAACPADAVPTIKDIPGIRVMKASGGHGAVREFIGMLIEQNDRV